MLVRSGKITASPHFAPAAIFTAAFLLRAVFLVLIKPIPVSDFAWYYERALGLLQGLGYTIHGDPTALWPPGWPYFMAAVIWFVGASPVAVGLVQALLGALTAWLAYLIARRIYGEPAGIAAGCAYAVLPSAVEWCATLASEPLFTFLWTLATYIWVTRSPESPLWFALSGVVLGLDALVRPSALFFWIVLLIYFLCVKDERKRFGKCFGAVALTAACTLIVVAPMIVRNYRVFDTLVLISNNGGVSLYESNNPSSSAGYTDLNNPQIERLIDDPRTEVEGDRLASRLALKYMREHPLREFTLSLRKIKALYSRDDSVMRYTLRSKHYTEAQSPPATDRAATALARFDSGVYYLLMLFAAIGLAATLAWRKSASRTPAWGLVLGLISYNTATFAVMGGFDRFRYPTMPYFCVFAGYGVMVAASFYGRWAHARYRAALSQD